MTIRPSRPGGEPGRRGRTEEIKRTLGVEGGGAGEQNLSWGGVGRTPRVAQSVGLGRHGLSLLLGGVTEIVSEGMMGCEGAFVEAFT
jgi:hypothetical protein